MVAQTLIVAWLLGNSHPSQEAPPQREGLKPEVVNFSSLAFHRPLRTVVSTPTIEVKVRTPLSWISAVGVPLTAVVQPGSFPQQLPFQASGHTVCFTPRRDRQGPPSGLVGRLPLLFYCSHGSCKHVAWHTAANL